MFTPKRSRRLLRHFLLLLCPAISLAQQPAATARYEGPTENDFVLTVRLSPSVKAETIQLLNQMTEPRTLRLGKNENVGHILARVYGAFLPRIETRLRALNPAIKDQSLNTFVVGEPYELKLPAGAEYYSNIVKAVQPKSDLKEQARLETGSDSTELMIGIKKKTEGLKNYFKDYCKTRTCTPLQKSVLASQKTIAFPFVSRYVSFTLKAEAKNNLPAILTQLQSDAGVVDAEIHLPAKLISPVSHALLSGLGVTCDASPSSSDWFIHSLSLQQLPLETLRGQNETTIAIMDSGIDRGDTRFNLWQNIPEVSGLENTDDDLNGYIDDKIGCNFIVQTDFPEDDQFALTYRNHGTHVAGLASGRFLSGPLLAAVTQRLNTMILKIADSNGFVDNGAVNDAIVYAQSKNAMIVNMSFEGEFSPSIRRYIKEDVGRLYVVAAGNGGIDGAGLNLDSEQNRRFPAKLAGEFANVISVAAHTQDGRLACFSNFGSKTVDVAAPGIEIESTIANGDVLKLSGTSQAAPLVSLAASLIRSQGIVEPSLIKQRIITSVDFMAEYRGKLSSEGKLNIAKAVSVFDDVVELNDDTRTLLRGKLIAPPNALQVGQQTIPFKLIKKIVNFSPENGATLQRITWLNQGRLEHLYGNVSIPTITLKVGDTCLQLKADEIRDVVTALVPSSQPTTCPGN